MFSSPGWIRTNDQPINSPKLTPPKPLKTQDLRPLDAAGRSAGRSADGAGEPEGGHPPDLAAVVAAWPTLPEPLRRAVLALIGAAG